MFRWEAQRFRNKADVSVKPEVCVAAMKNLMSAIRRNKCYCWRTLCENVNRNPCGKAYVPITSLLGTPRASTIKNAATIENIVDTLSHNHPTRYDAETLL